MRKVCIASTSTSSVVKPSERNSGIMRVKTLRDSLSSCSSSFSSSTADSTVSDPGLSSVRFNEVRIREYAVIIGDNPSCSNGAPVSLDWVHTTSDLRVHIEKYEEYRAPRRRHHAELRMPKMVRINLLMDNWDYSLGAIIEAEYETNKARDKRMKTSNKARKAILREESMKNRKQNLKKFFAINRTGKNKKQNMESVPPECIMIRQ